PGDGNALLRVQRGDRRPELAHASFDQLVFGAAATMCNGLPQGTKAFGGGVLVPCAGEAPRDPLSDGPERLTLCHDRAVPEVEWHGAFEAREAGRQGGPPVRMVKASAMGEEVRWILAHGDLGTGEHREPEELLALERRMDQRVNGDRAVGGGFTRWE